MSQGLPFCDSGPDLKDDGGGSRGEESKSILINQIGNCGQIGVNIFQASGCFLHLGPGCSQAGRISAGPCLQLSDL